MAQDGSLRVSRDFVLSSAERFAALLDLGQLNFLESILFISFLLSSLKVNEEGAVSFNRVMFETAAGTFEQKYSKAASMMTEPSTLDRIEALIERGRISLRVRRALGVALRPNLSALLPGQWVDKWMGSPAMDAAYGEQTIEHIQYLAETALQRLLKTVIPSTN